MNRYTPTIGLEIHAELKTLTKMFCDCRNDPDEIRPNVNICPICLGHPGTLPVINEEAVKHVLKVGVAVGGNLARLTEFDRKNYFYPDLPKAYQISQYKRPLIFGGELCGVKITRVHLEEDTGTSIHNVTEVKPQEKSSRFNLGYSLVNFNRAGVPLMELVTEPAMHSAAEAVWFTKELQLLIQYLEISEANMEKGEMRVEANVSVSRSDLKEFDSQGQTLGKLGTKVEIKNLNSFRAIERAIEFEIKRQSEILERGEKIAQETRGWDESKQETFSQRQKEESHDYRYFPDPDLPSLDISKIPEFNGKKIKETLPEAPQEKRKRFREEYSVKESDIEFYISNRELSDFFENVAKAGDAKFNQLASNYIVSDLASREKKFKEMSPRNFTRLVRMISGGEISSRGAKDILAVMLDSDRNPEEIATEKKLLQRSGEEELGKIADEIILENQKIVEEYRSGKLSILQFLVGQAMKRSHGSANPQVLKKILIQRLKSELRS